MPSTRQFRSIGLVTVLALCIVYYIYNGASNTYESDFYKRTKAVIERKKTTLERDQLFADEKDRASRVERLRKEHDAAVQKEEKITTSESEKVEAAVTEVVGGEKRIKGQKPLKEKDNGKVVQGAPEKDSDDGVAKIGNVRKPAAAVDSEVKGEDEEAAAKKKKDEAEVEAELNDILRKGPIIVFSKSYCPYSKKAKVSQCTPRFISDLLTSYTAHPPRPLQHNASTLRCGTRHTSSGTWSTKPSSQIYWTKNCP